MKKAARTMEIREAEFVLSGTLPVGQENVACLSQTERAGIISSSKNIESLPVGQENVACFSQTGGMDATHEVRGRNGQKIIRVENRKNEQ